MNIGHFARRFLVPRWGVSLYYYFKFHCKVSTRAEVDLSSLFTMGRGSEVCSFTKIKATYGPLRIGRDTFIGAGCFISSGASGLEIGDDCMISPHVIILANNYNYQKLDVSYWDQGWTSKGVRIGDMVWLGSGACILDGSRIGRGVIVTPNSVVSGVVPDYAIVQGNPAKVIFTRR
jgi:acetyltransferase-like isoleucine patch superfamily enzyme